MKAWIAVWVALAAVPAYAAEPQNQPPGSPDAQGLSRQEGQSSSGLGGQGAGQRSWSPDQGRLGTSTFGSEQQASDPEQAKQRAGSGQATELGQGKDCPPESAAPGCQQAAKPVEADQLRRENVPPSQFDRKGD